jgi:hypothetical protein
MVLQGGWGGTGAHVDRYCWLAVRLMPSAGRVLVAPCTWVSCSCLVDTLARVQSVRVQKQLQLADEHSTLQGWAVLHTASAADCTVLQDGRPPLRPASCSL